MEKFINAAKKQFQKGCEWWRSKKEVKDEV